MAIVHFQSAMKFIKEVLMDMERQESTIYHLEELHKAQERPLYGDITAGGIIN